MFRRSTDGVAVSASIRLSDGALLIGAINCGASGRIETLLAGTSDFIEYVSKEGQQRFIARHQIASIEPVGPVRTPVLPAVENEIDAFEVIGVRRGAKSEEAMEAFKRLVHLYHPDRWTGDEVPFEFRRYAVEKMRQLHAAFTVVRAAIQEREARHEVTPVVARFGGARLAP